MEIRKMGIEDYRQAHDLWMSCPGMRLNDLDDSRDGLARFLERNPGTCFVAEEDDGLVGTILAGNDGRRGYIYHLAVRPGYRRRGIGRALVTSVLGALRSRNIAKVALVVFEGNADGNGFWERVGFTRRDDLVYRNRALAEMVTIDT
jgi:ribosomal protein S18 acetylase RimI-like enzyme